MDIASAIKDPEFRITRSSHVRYYVRDLAKSVHFWTEILGLVITEQDSQVAYLRGIEEACHHSVVLQQIGWDAPEVPEAECMGMRVWSDECLNKLQVYVREQGGTAEFIERAHQGPTLMTRFGEGAPPIEFTSSMPVVTRQLNNFPAQKGGRVLRLDHYQCTVPSVNDTAGKFMGAGFRTSKYTTHADDGRILAIFLTRKNNPHDLVLAEAAGPRLHHVAFVVSDLQAMFRACDIAANYGYGRSVERGPGRHGPPNGLFVYFRDPDGNRIEFILPPMQYMDPEDQPNVWDSNDGVSLVPWGDDPPERWRSEMTHFRGIEPAGGTKARWVSSR